MEIAADSLFCFAGHTVSLACWSALISLSSSFSRSLRLSTLFAASGTAAAEGHRPSPLVEAIESSDPAAVPGVLEALNPDERRRELTTECAGTGGGQRLDGDASSSTVMLPIFHAACTGNAEVFLATLGALKASLSEDEVSLGSAFTPAHAAAVLFSLNLCGQDFAV